MTTVHQGVNLQNSYKIIANNFKFEYLFQLRHLTQLKTIVIEIINLVRTHLEYLDKPGKFEQIDESI